MVLQLADDFCWGFGGLKAVPQQTSKSSFEFPLKANEMNVRMDPVPMATFSGHPYCAYQAFIDTSGTKPRACSQCCGCSARFMQSDTVSHWERHSLCPVSVRHISAGVPAAIPHQPSLSRSSFHPHYIGHLCLHNVPAKIPA